MEVGVPFDEEFKMLLFTCLQMVDCSNVTRPSPTLEF